MINVNEKSMKNVKMKKIVEKKSSKKKKNFDMMIFEIVNVKDSNAEIFMKYHIDDTMTISNNFRNFFSNLKNFQRKRARRRRTRKNKKKVRRKTRTKVLGKRKRRKQMSEFRFFV